MSNHENLNIADLQLDDENPHSPLINEEIALNAELDGLQKINNVIDGVCNALSKGKENMALLSQTVDNANKLLDLWTRVLSQTEHTQRLILNGRWQGITRDSIDIEAEAQAKKLRAQRDQERAATAERAKCAVIKEEEKTKSGDKRGRGRVLSSGYGQIRPSTRSNETPNLRGIRGTGTSRGTLGRSNSTRGRGIARDLLRGVTRHLI
ncbi:DASH complex subunit duo1 [Neolecta irregularis DAH-3]|uniref:DASH complex subunit DUO1 n=1 Tax=Neolecta irregularis (strain DAH-3) TaxID=1198029 RepID=A0A1U7LH35_NEOID|nr:DASH complex subunit duo1 [Neolecta irregularis DAH-3]|eukprot:OLL21959.1 DASH complex subunit duo1 [Neolecta irregularis DAH-3]